MPMCLPRGISITPYSITSQPRPPYQRDRKAQQRERQFRKEREALILEDLPPQLHPLMEKRR